MATAPFIMPPQAPLNFNFTPDTLLEAVHTVLDDTRKLQDRIVATIQPEYATFDNAILPLIENENVNIGLRKHRKFHSSTSTSAGLREASIESEALESKFAIQTMMRQDLFKVIDAVHKRGERLDPESQLYLDQLHSSFVKNGLSLSSEKRDRFAEIKTEIQVLHAAYLKVLNSRRGIWLQPEELEGFPKERLSSLEPGKEENEGKVFLPFRKPHLELSLKFVKSGVTRRTIYTENDESCLENAPRFKETVLLRDEAARLLGYKNHAELRLEDKMMKTTKFVNDFLKNHREQLAELGEQSIAELSALKRKSLREEKLWDANDKEKTEFFIWDHSFYKDMIKVGKLSFDEKVFSEYFTLESSLEGMLSTFSSLFGIGFSEILKTDFDRFGPGHVLTWHDDVRVFTVWDDESNGGSFLGYLYLDLFPREQKYNHAGHFGLHPGFISPTGERICPSSVLVMNLTAPQPSKPTMLAHDEIRSMFHELGHAVHNLLSRTKYAFFHGTAVPRDFVEIPSIMLENWWWDPTIIKTLSLHYSYLSDDFLAAWKKDNPGMEQPGRNIDDELLASLVKTRHQNEALTSFRNIHIAMYDMAIHSPASRDELESMDLSVMWHQMLSDITMMKGTEALGEGWSGRHGNSRLGALMRGYDAGYYAYPLAKAYAQDLFTAAFEKDPMSREVGMKYRKIVLEPGANKDGMEILEEFLGRKPDLNARFKELGIAH
ncbi:zincin [Coleophoma crateriformis]|uniref:Zincin n=1 Tax=Coleophoma crateriformis TaxID=565419 RepID=A0A3D8T1C9_9HELO|nr:zincin [Coleophoma crateriformis]